MTSLHRNTVTSAAAFFAICTATLACGPGGGGRPVPSYPSYPTYPTYPSDYSSNSSNGYIVPASMTQTVPVTPISPNLTTTTTLKPVTPTAPQARIKVLPANAAPAARIQLTSPVADEAKAKVVQVAKVESKPGPKVNEADAATVLDTLTPAKEASSKIADALKGLVGPWMAVSRQGDGELSTVELLLNDNGWAKLTIPGADGKPSTTTRKVEFENNEIKLTGGDADVLLGKLVESNSRQMVLERSGSQVTFVRP
jgi:hypothetical protein